MDIPTRPDARASLHESRSLFHSSKAETVRALHPDLDFLRGVSG